MSQEKPLQDQLHKDHPIRNCFGCGADNHGGLQLKSMDEGDEIVAHLITMLILVISMEG